MALHSPDDVAAFLGDRVTRLIAARYRGDERRGEIYILPQGGAATLKEWTRLF